MALLDRRAGWEAGRAYVRTLEEWCATVRENLRDPQYVTYQEKRNILAMLAVSVNLYPATHTPRYEIFASLDPDMNPSIVRSTTA